MDDKVYDQREDLWRVEKGKLKSSMTGKTYDLRRGLRSMHEEIAMRADVVYRVNQLSAFLDALDEWGCVDHTDMARAIIKFEDSGMDLEFYRDKD